MNLHTINSSVFKENQQQRKCKREWKGAVLIFEWDFYWKESAEGFWQLTLEPVSFPALFLAALFGWFWACWGCCCPCPLGGRYTALVLVSQLVWSRSWGGQSWQLGCLSIPVCVWDLMGNHSPFLGCGLLGLLSEFYSQTLPWGPCFSLAPFHDFSLGITEL